jgi:hypothetical protein
MNKIEELKAQGWLMPKDPEPGMGQSIRYYKEMLTRFSKGFYVENGTVVDDDNNMVVRFDLWKPIRTNAESVVNFAYFTANFPPDFIKKCWADDDHLIDHISHKLRSSDGSMISMGDFMRFFMELDKKNQIKLSNWIENNYYGK